MKLKELNDGSVLIHKIEVDDDHYIIYAHVNDHTFEGREEPDLRKAMDRHVKGVCIELGGRVNKQVNCHIAEWKRYASIYFVERGE